MGFVSQVKDFLGIKVSVKSNKVGMVREEDEIDPENLQVIKTSSGGFKVDLACEEKKSEVVSKSVVVSKGKIEDDGFFYSTVGEKKIVVDNESVLDLGKSLESDNKVHQISNYMHRRKEDDTQSIGSSDINTSSNVRNTLRNYIDNASTSRETTVERFRINNASQLTGEMTDNTRSYKGSFVSQGVPAESNSAPMFVQDPNQKNLIRSIQTKDYMQGGLNSIPANQSIDENLTSHHHTAARPSLAPQTQVEEKKALSVDSSCSSDSSSFYEVSNSAVKQDKNTLHIKEEMGSDCISNSQRSNLEIFKR